MNKEGRKPGEEITVFSPVFLLSLSVWFHLDTYPLFQEALALPQRAQAVIQ
jgi:hypothetical protein